jgi:hypothetical protein
MREAVYIARRPLGDTSDMPVWTGSEGVLIVHFSEMIRNVASSRRASQYASCILLYPGPHCKVFKEISMIRRQDYIAVGLSQ